MSEVPLQWEVAIDTFHQTLATHPSTRAKSVVWLGVWVVR